MEEQILTENGKDEEVVIGANESWKKKLTVFMDKENYEEFEYLYKAAGLNFDSYFSSGTFRKSLYKHLYDHLKERFDLTFERAEKLRAEYKRKYIRYQLYNKDRQEGEYINDDYLYLDRLYFDRVNHIKDHLEYFEECLKPESAGCFVIETVDRVSKLIDDMYKSVWYPTIKRSEIEKVNIS